MSYTPVMRELIKKVEATRPQRLEMARNNQHFPDLSLEEREMLLKKFHPDYMDQGRRAVKVGPNKGDVFPEEVVDLLESKGRIDSHSVDLNKIDYETDILVIGGGGAGTAARCRNRKSGWTRGCRAMRSRTSCCRAAGRRG